MMVKELVTECVVSVSDIQRLIIVKNEVVYNSILFIFKSLLVLLLVFSLIFKFLLN